MQPVTLHIQDLKDCPCWVGCTISSNGKKEKKIPCDNFGNPINPHDPKNQRSYEDVTTPLKGFVLNDDNPFVIIDIDKTTENPFSYLDTYVESSYSKNGSHIICQTDKEELKEFLALLGMPFKGGTRNQETNLEIYTKNRFFLVTGDCINDTPINYVNPGDLLSIIDEIMPSKVLQRPEGVILAPSPTMTDERVIELALNQKKGTSKFVQYWHAEGHEGDSNIDQSCINTLAFYTQDPDQLKRLMLNAPRYRDKFITNPVYLDISIQSALSILDTTYQARKEKDPKKSAFYIPEKADLYEQPWYEGTKFSPIHLVEYIKSQNTVIFKSGVWYKYSESKGTFQIKNETEMQNYIYKFIAIPSCRILNEVLGLLRARCVNEGMEFNTEPECINFLNSTYNGSLGSHNKALRSTFSIPHLADEEATCPNWDGFLKGTLSKKDYKLLQEMFGYFLTTSLKGKAFFMWEGITDTGKSVASFVLSKLIGYDKISNVSLQDICSPSKAWTLGEMHNKLVNINNDISHATLTDTSRLREFTGDPMVRYEKKYQEAFSGAITARLLFLCNRLPKLKGQAGDFFERLHIVKFTKQIPKAEQNHNLHEELCLEMPGIINWALKGLERLIANNYVFTSDRDKVDEYELKHNSVMLFAEECIEITGQDTDTIQAAQLYQHYAAFVLNSGMDKPVSRQEFNSELLSKRKGLRHYKSSFMKFSGLVYRPHDFD